MPKFNHVMLDLETLSLRSDACIIQIAAVAFDIETGKLGPRFNAYVNESCLVGAKVGHIDVSTVGFWMRQKFGPTLGAAITDEDEQRYLPDALGEFDQWFADLAEDTTDHADCFGGVKRVDSIDEICVWSHGAGFDIPILASAYDRAELGEVPWHYRAPRDTRTLFALAPGGMPRLPKDEAREHDAQYDCEYQVAQVCGAYAALRQQRELAESYVDLESNALACEDTQRATSLAQALAEVERWKEEYRVTEAARAAFEAAEPVRGSLVLPPAVLQHAEVSADEVMAWLRERHGA